MKHLIMSLLVLTMSGCASLANNPKNQYNPEHSLAWNVMKSVHMGQLFKDSENTKDQIKGSNNGIHAAITGGLNFTQIGMNYLAFTAMDDAKAKLVWEIVKVPTNEPESWLTHRIAEVAEMYPDTKVVKVDGNDIVLKGQICRDVITDLKRQGLNKAAARREKRGVCETHAYDMDVFLSTNANPELFGELNGYSIARFRFGNDVGFKLMGLFKDGYRYFPYNVFTKRPPYVYKNNKVFLFMTPKDGQQASMSVAQFFK